jgi:hypothetical protein
MQEIDKNKKEISFYNFNVLEKYISKNIYFKRLFNHYDIDLKKYNTIKINYNFRFDIEEIKKIGDPRIFKSIFSCYKYNNQEIDIIKYIRSNSIIKQKKLYMDKCFLDYSLNNNNYYYFLKHHFKYNQNELSEFRYDSDDYYLNINEDQNKMAYIKNCINVFSKVLMREGKYINVYTLIDSLLFEIRLKELDIYEFFNDIFKKVYLPISLYKKRVAGRKILVPNPYNVNYYMNNRS